MVLAVVLLALGLVSLATGKTMLPNAIGRRLRRVPATPADQRWQGAAVAIGSCVILLNGVGVLVDAAGPSNRGLHLIVLLMSTVFLVVFLIVVLRLRSVDRTDGSVSTGWDQVKKAFGG